MRGTESEAVVGGANAVYYLVDGLYPTDTYVVAHGDAIYLLAGAYLTVDDQIHHDFEALVDSFTFIEAQTDVDMPAPAETSSNDVIVCTDAQKAAEICTMEYAPVCGQVAVECVTTPCNPVPETFSNGCMACAHGKVVAYTAGACTE